MQIRLQKYLSDCGIASRRKSEQLILDGKVTVNDLTITELGSKIEPGKDIIKFNNKIVLPKENLIYIMLHKPEGYITTVKDQFSRPTIMDLIKDIDNRIFPIGRLDYNTSGLVLLTNDGDLTHKLTHPSHNIDKIYIAKFLGTPSNDELQKFRTGIVIDGQKTAPAEIQVIKKDDKYTSVKITLREGRNRQVRKMCEGIGHKVVALKRIATGKLFLGDLKRGEYRKLTEKEIKYLKSL